MMQVGAARFGRRTPIPHSARRAASERCGLGLCGDSMAVAGFSLFSSPETFAGAQTVGMVLDRCKAWLRTDAAACSWLTAEVRDGRLKLSWVESSPEYQHGLYLHGESFIYFPCFPGAQATDELDWGAGVLRRRVRYPSIPDRWGGRDPSKMTMFDRLERDKELRARHEPSALELLSSNRGAAPHAGSEEWITKELIFPFRVERASLAGVLDRVSRDIPVTDRAKGEPGECGCWRDSAEEQEAAQTAPDLLAAYRTKMRGLPQLVEERRRYFEGGSLVFVNNDFDGAVRAELRAPLKEHFDRQLRAGKWICYGFSEERGGRVRIGSPWRDGLSFDHAGGMTDKQGGLYSDVLFYRATELLCEPVCAQPQSGLAAPVVTQAEKARLRSDLKDFLESETRNDPPRALTKAEWLHAARHKFGADAVTDNLFDKAWRNADLADKWRAPGRRT